MISPAKVSASKLNGALSKGPRTATGKQKSKLNSLAHGLLCQSATLPGENAKQWRRFREAIVKDITPVGAVEEMFCERIAVLSWRLQRVVRHEQAVSTERLKQVEKGNDSTLANSKRLNEKINEAEKHLAKWVSKRNLFALFELSEETSVDPDTTYHIFEFFGMVFTQYSVDPQDGEFLKSMGVEVTLPDDLDVDEYSLVNWTVQHLHLGAKFIAGLAQETADVAIVKVQAEIEKVCKEAQDEIKQYRKELSLLESQMEQHLGHLTALHGVPDNIDTVMRYESHIQRQLLSALHEVQRLQSGRLHGNTALPTAIDITVTSNQGNNRLFDENHANSFIPGHIKQVEAIQSPLGC